MPGRTFQALDLSRRSGAIAIGFQNRTIDLRNIWGGGGFIGADIYSKAMETEIRVINVYGPCQNREVFGEGYLATPSCRLITSSLEVI